MPILHEFPYGNTHDQNYDWILKVVKEMLDKYGEIDASVASALEQIENAKNGSLEEMETALNSAIDAINEAISGIGESEQSALTNINTAKSEALTQIDSDKDTALSEISNARSSAESAISADQSTAQQAINSDKDTALSEISTARTSAENAISADQSAAQQAINADKIQALNSIALELDNILDDITYLRNTFPSNGDELIGEVYATKNQINNLSLNLTWQQGVYDINPPYSNGPILSNDAYKITTYYQAGCAGRNILITCDALLTLSHIICWTGGFSSRRVVSNSEIIQLGTNSWSLSFEITDVYFSVEMKKVDDSAIIPADGESTNFYWDSPLLYAIEMCRQNDSTTALDDYAIGDLFTHRGKIYKCTGVIADGAAIVFPPAQNANCINTTIEELLHEAGLVNVDEEIEKALFPIKGGTKQIVPEWTNGYYYNASLQPVAYSGMKIAKVDISDYINGTLTMTTYATSSAFCGFSDDNDAVIDVWHQTAEASRTIPINAKYLYISYDPRVTFACSVSYEEYEDVKEAVHTLENEMDNVPSLIDEAVAPFMGGTTAITPTWTQGYYYNGSLQPVAYSSMRIAKVDISDYINATLAMTAYASGSAFCGFTDNNDSIIYTWHQTAEASRTIPINAKYLYISQDDRVTFACSVTSEKIPKAVAYINYANGIKEYDSTKNYIIGDLCSHEGALMHCIANTTGAFNSNDWQKTTFVDEFGLRDYIYPITKLNGLSLKACGDSITAGSNGPSYVPIMANLLGITNYTNSGIGGAYIGTCYNGAAVTDDIVTLLGGTNDFGLSTGANTLANFRTSVQNIITNFRTNNQTARLYMITPIPRFDKTVNEYNNTLLDYVNAMEEICADMDVPCLNLYERCGINENNYSTYLKAAQGDLIHPNAYGAMRIAVEIANFVSEMEAIYRVHKFR